MQQHLEVFEGDEPLPKEADIVVVGAGIIGVSAAYFLAERGLKVVVIEKGVVGAEQSSRNWGWCRTAERDVRELPLMLESVRLWRSLNERIQAETGYRECGIVTVSHRDEDVERQREWVRQAKDFGVDARILSSAECRSLLPHTARDWRGGIYTPNDGRAEPGLVTPRLAKAAVAKGAAIKSRCAVNGIERAGGAVCGVHTTKGYVKSTSVIVAGGIWSSRLCRSLNIRFPQLGVLATVLQTAPIPGGPDISATGNGFSFRKRLDGGYTVSCGAHGIVAPLSMDSFRYFRDFLPVLREEWRKVSFTFLKQAHGFQGQLPKPSTAFECSPILDPRPLERDVHKAKKNLSEWFPALFSQCKIVAQWGGVVDVTPDSLPVISPISQVPGLVLASGFSGHGFGLGPAAGALAAAVVTGEDGNDATPFRFERLSAQEQA